MTLSHATLLHVEDSPVWVDLVEKLVGRWKAISYLGAAGTIREAREQCIKNPPDLLLLDLWLADGDGLSLAGEIRRAQKSVRIILCTVRKDDVTLHAFDRLALSGMIWKEVSLARTLKPALETVMGGGRVFPPELLERRRQLRRDPTAYYKLLSDREQALLPQFGSGGMDAHIARSEGVSVHTVRNQRQSIMAKLNLRKTVQLALWAVSRGFLPPPNS